MIVFSITLCILAALIIRIVPGRLGATLLPVLLAVQMELTFLLMAGTGLAMRAVGDLQGRDVGVNPSGLLSADVYLPRDPYVTLIPAEPGRVELAQFNAAGPALYDRIRGALQTMPGVVQAAGAGTHPFASNPFVQFFVGDAEHTPDNQVAAQYLAVTENYFNTIGVRIVRGRDFSAADRADSPWVVLVNETLARQQWPNGDPIGQKVTLTFQPKDEEPQREIIGVVADTIPFRGASEVPPLIYVLHRQQATRQRASLEGRRTVMSFIVRTSGDPLALGDAVRAQVGKIDPTTPVASIKTVESYLNAGQTVLLQFVEMLLGIFALVALVSCAAGVYALPRLASAGPKAGSARAWRMRGRCHRHGGGTRRVAEARQCHRAVPHEPPGHASGSDATRRHRMRAPCGDADRVSGPGAGTLFPERLFHVTQERARERLHFLERAAAAEGRAHLIRDPSVEPLQ